LDKAFDRDRDVFKDGKVVKRREGEGEEEGRRA
jgi:hypothetical protein